MYVPKYFEEKDKASIEQLIREFGFATMVSIQDGLPIATHIPLELSIDEPGDWILFGHVAKGNSIWKTFQNNTEVLAIFMGPHAYVSPSWYNHKNVPTWNYLAAHIYGIPRVLESEETATALRKLMGRYEQLHAEHPQTLDEVPPNDVAKDLAALVAFEIKVTRIDAVAKLSQNRDAESYQNVIDHLRTSDAYDSKRVAEEMEKRKRP